MKYCKDCKYFVDTGFYSLGSGTECEALALLKEDVIWGPRTSVPRTNREDESKCGAAANFFEPKVEHDTKSWFLWRR